MPTDYHDSPALPGFLKPALSPPGAVAEARARH
jgi:hypothetical protein